MKQKVSVLIDAGYVREVLKKNKVFINAIAIHNIVRKCIDEEEETLHKILYYDCRPNKKSNNTNKKFRNDELIDELSRKERYAVRLGNLKYMGQNEKGAPLFVQKGVDIKLALDVSKIIMANKIHRIILITGDTDIIPAMKMARIHDIEIVLIHMAYLTEELYSHMDFMRNIDINKMLEEKTLLKYNPQNLT